MTIEEIEKGELDGKVAVQGKRVSIPFTSKSYENMDDDVSSPVWLFQVSTLYTGKVFESNLEEAPLRFRLGKKYFRYLSLLFQPS